MTFFARRSIRSKLLTVTLAAGLPVVLVALFHLSASSRSDYDDAEHAVQVTAAAIAHQHEASVAGIQNLLVTLSQFPEVKHRDRAACDRLLKNILREIPNSYNIGIADPQGNLIASAVSRNFVIGDRKYFKDALRTKRFSVGEYTVSRAVRKPTLHFALPVLDDRGEVSAVLYAAYDLNAFNSIFTSHELPPNSVLNVTDHQGILIHRYPSSPLVPPGLADRPDLRARMTGPNDEGVFNDYGRDNVKRLLAFKRLRLHPGEAPYLYVRVSVPEVEALRHIRRLIVIYVSVFFLAWGLALLLSRSLAARFLIAPLERIARVSRAAKDGDFSVRTELPYDDDEIGTLARSIDSMSEALETRRQERERADAVQLRMRQELQESERRFRDLLENVHLVAVILDGQGRITFCNDYLLKLTGWEREQVVGREWFSIFVPEEDRHGISLLFQGALASSSIPSHYENRIVTRGGALRTIDWDNTLLRGNDGEVVGTASIGIDVTDHRVMEEQLLQAKKMEAVGKLAGGVAHDFNNLMTPIMGYADLARAELERLGGRVDRIDHIINAAMKARDLTRQLLSFSRKQALTMQVIDLNLIIEALADMLRRTVRENIDIVQRIAAAPAFIKADRTQVEMVVMNLVVNAQDAIEMQGRIAIETERIILDEEYALLHPGVDPGDYIMLAISDTGKGMEEDVLDHIFEPFFTTRSATGGTGLGLATVYGIMKQHGGHIEACSERGHGSVFKVYFPSVEAPWDVEEKTANPRPETPVRRANILLVEDNETVRALVHELLRTLGHEVFAAEDPEQALRLVAEGVRPELLVTDVVMPGMTGTELFRCLQEQQPHLKALFMSGYTSSFVTDHVELREGHNFIQKPFAISALAGRISEILYA